MNDEIRKSRSSNHDYYQYMLKLLGEELLPDFKVSLHKYLLIMMKKQLYNRKSRQTHLDKMIDINYEMHAIVIKYKGKNTGLLLWHPDSNYEDTVDKSRLRDILQNYVQKFEVLKVKEILRNGSRLG